MEIDLVFLYFHWTGLIRNQRTFIRLQRKDIILLLSWICFLSGLASERWQRIVFDGWIDPRFSLERVSKRERNSIRENEMVQRTIPATAAGYTTGSLSSDLPWKQNITCRYHHRMQESFLLHAVRLMKERIHFESEMLEIVLFIWSTCCLTMSRWFSNDGNRAGLSSLFSWLMRIKHQLHGAKRRRKRLLKPLPKKSSVSPMNFCNCSASWWAGRVEDCISSAWSNCLAGKRLLKN